MLREGNPLLLLSSFTDGPTERFEGHAFIGADYVIGQRGAGQYGEATGEPVRRGHDGCYTVITKHRQGWEIGTDGRGMARLFVYSQGGRWAISSSFHGLVRHLRSHGVTLTPNLAMVSHFQVRISFTGQLTSPRTMFREIELVPSTCMIVLDEHGPRIVGTPAPEESSYDEALHHFLSIWRARLRTLLNDERVSLAADLSGGLDSRTVMSFLLSEGSFNTGESRFRVASSPSRKDDFAAASTIAEHYGLDLNGPPHNPQTPRSASRAYDAWRESSLGVYLPFYAVLHDFDPFTFQVHGAGGEGAYKYLRGDNPEQLVDRLRNRLHPDCYDEWRSDVLRGARQLSDHRPGVDPMILLYREYRNRFHFGHRPERKAMFTPMNSVLIDGVVDRDEPRPNRQLHFDVMESLVPGLMTFPFDDPKKESSEEIRENITRVEVGDLPSGSIFGDIELLGEDPGTIDSPYEQWLDDAARSLQNPDVRDFIGEKATVHAENTILDAGMEEKQLGSHHLGMLDLSYARFVDLALHP